MSLNLSFPDITYSSSNKPSVITLKSDLTAIESDVNAHEASETEHGLDSALAAWTSWTPTWTNLTKGNAVINSYYAQIGKTVHFRISLVWGNTTSCAGTVQFSLPVTSVSYSGTASLPPIGETEFFDGSTGVASGVVTWATTTTAYPAVYNSTGTYVERKVITATVPFTWATNFELHMSGTYEAA